LQVAARFGAKGNIRSNTVAAGLIASEMAEAGMQSEAVKQAAANILLKRRRKPLKPLCFWLRMPAVTSRRKRSMSTVVSIFSRFST